MKPNFPFEKDMDDLLIRYVIEDITDEDRKKVNLWLAENKENRHYFEQLKDIYSLGKTMKNPSGFDHEKSLERIKSRYYKIRFNQLSRSDLKLKSNRFDFRKAVAAAAAILLVVSLGFNLRSYFRSPVKQFEPVISEAFNEINSPYGSRTQVTLPDGTQVWLNAGSSIKYPMNFLESDRKVILSGEAYFDVKKYSKKKFIVNASDIAVQVWGTKFNVKAYPDEETIKTTLVEGSVSIIELGAKKEKKETYITPNQTAIFYRRQKEQTEKPDKVQKPMENIAAITPVEIKSEVNTVLHTSWKDKNWFIEGESLGTLARELERRYNIHIQFDNEAIKNYRFTGTIAEETFEQILEIIGASAPVDYKINNNQVVLTHDLGSKSKYDEFLKKKTN